MSKAQKIALKKIEERVDKILKEARLTEPPLDTLRLLDFLNLDRNFYSLDDPGFIQSFVHKAKIQTHKILSVIKKIRIVAAWTPDNKTIHIDKSLPQPKQDWSSLHEVSHSIIPWHQPFFLGDTAQTLDPDFQEKLEFEANFGSSRFMFCGTTFSSEARQTLPCWKSVEELRQRYRTSYSTTLRRYVLYSHQTPMAFFASTASWQQTPEDQTNRWRHFIPNNEFESLFPEVSPAHILSQIDKNVQKRRGGPVGDFIVYLDDSNGETHELRAESFFNSHYVQTLIVYKRKIGKIVVF